MSPNPEKQEHGFGVQQVERESELEGPKAVKIVDYERGQLLASLGDPDQGKTEEERKLIDKKLMWKVDLQIVPWLSLL
jgi:hypothetical protein